MGTRAQVDLAAAGAVSLADAARAVDEAGRRKIGAWNALHQLFHVGVGVVDQQNAGVDHLAQVVRRNIGGHADRDAGRAVDQQVRHPGGQHQRLLFGFVVIGQEIDGLLVQIGKQFVRDLRHAHLGVAHRRG